MMLVLVEKVRNSIVDKIIFPMVNNIGMTNNNAGLIVKSGDLKQYVRKYDEAKDIYTYVIQHNKLAEQKNALELAYYSLGNTFMKKGDYTNAAKAYYLVLRRNYTHKDALLKFSRINMAYDNLDVIIPLAEVYSARRPRDAEPFAELCAIYDRKDNFVAARKNCVFAIKYNRNYARAHYDYAAVLKKNGYPEEAEKELRLAKKIQPGIKSRRELEDILRSYKQQVSK